MPSIMENQEKWSNYSWSRSGDEWSTPWGGTDELWWGAIYPRIRSYLPARTVLEIAPGMGRFTEFLRHFVTGRYFGIDLTERCVDECRRRFHGSQHMTFHQNDGLHLIPVCAPTSVDFAFSFDSLVHVEQIVIESYMRELAVVLTKNGVAFLHHSNLAACPENAGHYRSASVSAESFERASMDAGLSCIVQEIIGWGKLNKPIDCLTVITRPESQFFHRPRKQTNLQWMEAASLLRQARRLHGP